MKITVDPAVAWLFCKILKVQRDAQMYIPFIENTLNMAPIFHSENRLKVSTTAGKKEAERIEDHFGSDRTFNVSPHSNPSYVKMVDYFHYAFCVPHFIHESSVIDGNVITQVKPVQTTDPMLHFKCSQGSESRAVSEHLLVLEQMMSAVFCGGYFGAVLPERWFGRKHRYMQWWENHAAKVARIKLPDSVVVYPTIDYDMYADGKNCMHQSYLDEKRNQISSGKWELWIWSRPLVKDDDTPRSTPNAPQLDWAGFRHPLFTYTLDSLEPDSVRACVASFDMSMWNVAHVRHFNKLVSSSQNHSLFGTKHGVVRIPEESDIEIISANERTMVRVEVLEDIEAIKKIKGAVQIVPTRSRIKLVAHRKSGAVVLADLNLSDGFDTDPETGVHTHAIRSRVLNLDFSECSETLITKIEDFGGIPCMTLGDVKLMKKSARKLDIALTPIERVIPITVIDKDGKEQEVWEKLYEDSGMWATFPEIMEQWKQRALKMRMDKVLFPFQLDDVIVQAAKGCSFNGNVMGLGKTREMLFTAILRGVKRCLIIAPTKLIGTWQDEIDQEVLPYVRRVRRHWNGELMNIGRAHIIEHADDLLEENLGYFNIMSYDKAKSTLRDGRFYKCPACGMVVYSPYSIPQFCPGREDQYNADPELDTSCVGPLRRWKLKVKSRYEPAAYETLGKLKFSKHKIQISTGNKVHWDESHPSREGIPESDCKIVDTRDSVPGFSGRPYPPVMEKQDSMFKKYQMKETGVDEDTGEPVIKPVARGMHVKWACAELNRNRFQMIIADEILYVKNEDSQRSLAVNHINGDNRCGCTGTPLKGNPQSIINYINWLIKRKVFPHYRLHEKGALRRFLDKFETIVRVDAVIDAEGNPIGGRPKQVPKINNPELFQAEMAPIMVRHLRNEPRVLESIPRIPIERHEHIIDMDDQHRDYYQKWIDKFSDWWEKMKEEVEKKKSGKGQLIVKLSYLINASANPHFMLERLTKSKDAEFQQWALEIGKYTGPATAKMKFTRELVRAAAVQGDKSLVFSTRHRVLDLQHEWAKKVRLGSMVIDGRVSLKIDPATGRSKRHDMVQAYRAQNYHVIWGGLGALAEGMNIPEANHGIVTDYSWEPSDPMQAIGRMIRPQQKKRVYTHFLCHKGTIDEYMAALCYLKGRSHSEGIDYMDFEFKTELIPDIQQYANAIVDGTETIVRRTMWAAVEQIKKEMQEEGEDY